jgi:hypothetical protein
VVFCVYHFRAFRVFRGQSFLAGGDSNWSLELQPTLQLKPHKKTFLVQALLIRSVPTFTELLIGAMITQAGFVVEVQGKRQAAASSISTGVKATGPSMRLGSAG